jgi:hypothetical protein
MLLRFAQYAFEWAVRLIFFLWAVLLLSILVGPADASEGIRARVSVTTDVLHGQGYWAPSLRVGYDGGIGIRYSRLTAPMWAREIPDEFAAQAARWKIESAGVYEIDKEFCGTRWCGALGAAYINRHTVLNGTHWNFGLHIRYKIDHNWSLVLDHYSHGSMLGIADDKSNRGWNLLGVAYTW